MTLVTGAPPVAAAGLGGPFWRMLAAGVVSRFGDAIRGPALSLMAAALTRDPATIALVVIAGQVPPLLFGLLGGALADRWDRRLSMAVTDALRCILVAGLAAAVAFGHASVWLLATFAFALSTLGTLFVSSSFAMVPELVQPDQLAKANGRLQIGTTIGGLLGTPIAGGLFVVAVALPFAVDAVTFAVAALLALTLPRPQKPAVPAVRASLWHEAAEGVRWIWRSPMLRLLAWLTCAANLVIGALMAVMVLLILDVFRVPEAAYGLFTLVGAAGGIIGGLGASRLSAKLGTLPTLRMVFLLQALALAALAAAAHPIPGGFALGVFIAGSTVWNVLSNTYQQQAVPADRRGRTGAASRVLGVASAPVGAALGGALATHQGVVAVTAFGAAVFALLTIIAWRPLAATASPPPL